MSEKRCTQCGKEKALSLFHKQKRQRDGVRSECKECICLRERNRRNENKETHIEKNRRYKENNRERLREYDANRRRLGLAKPPRKTEKTKPRSLLNEAVRYGRLKKPTACEKCGQETPSRRLHGHHRDYSKSLDVQWLCSICHGKEHWIVQQPAARKEQASE